MILKHIYNSSSLCRTNLGFNSPPFPLSGNILPVGCSLPLDRREDVGGPGSSIPPAPRAGQPPDHPIPRDFRGPAQPFSHKTKQFLLPACSTFPRTTQARLWRDGDWEKDSNLSQCEYWYSQVLVLLDHLGVKKTFW